MRHTNHPGLTVRLVTTAAALLLVMSASASAALQDAAQETPSQDGAPLGLPYIYSNWQQFTVEDGLPNDHIFAVEIDGPMVWVGTENGLARIDKRTGAIDSWNEEDGLPWRVVSALAANQETGELWVGLFGGGLARFSGGRFDHFHQLNSGLVNDVVYGLAIQGDNVWVATTAGANRFNPVTGEWAIFTEKNAPMEEIWNYGVTYNDGLVYLGVWGSGVLEFDVATEQWKVYLDPDGEMEIDLYRDDGIVHVITTGVSFIDSILWVGSYFGGSRYDGRHWRGYYAHECGLPSDFINAVAGRSANEAWYVTDKGVGVVTDFASDTWVTYTLVPETHSGRAVVSRGIEIIETVEMGVNIPHNYALWTELDGDDVWIGTSKGLAWGKGNGYYPGLAERPAAGDGGEESNGGKEDRK